MDDVGRGDGRGQGRERVCSRRYLTTMAAATATATATEKAAVAVGRPEEEGGKRTISKLTLPSKIPKSNTKKEKSNPY